MQCDTETKECRACFKVLPLTDFQKKKERPGGRLPRCKQCVKEEVHIQKDTAVQDTGVKKCSKCKETKDVSQFNKRVNRATGIQSQCKACISASKVYDPEKSRQWLLKKYGINQEIFDELLNSQNNSCAICKVHINDAYKDASRKAQLCVDHCHTTGKVRGLLCDKCNRGIGLLQDNLSILKNAVIYLEKNN